MQARETSLPFVIGSLMVLFGGVSVWLNAHALRVGRNVIDGGVVNPTIVNALLVAGVAKAVIHVFAGVRALTYKPDATRWALIYASVAIGVNACAFFAAPDGERSASWLSRLFDQPVRSLYDDLVSVGTLVSFAWPVIVAIAMTRSRVRVACQPAPRVDELPKAQLHK